MAAGADADLAAAVTLAVDAPGVLGESPFWHPREQVLYWCDIPAHRLYRHDPATGDTRHWPFDTDVACCAPMLDGGVLLAMRDGVWRLDTATGKRRRLAEPPYDPAVERFNDGKCDPQGRFWAGTIYEPRDAAKAALYRLRRRRMVKEAGGVTTSNGLAWSPAGRTMYWSDTRAHVVVAFDVDPADGSLSRRRDFARFAPRAPGEALNAAVEAGRPSGPGGADGGAVCGYGGRPDGAAVDTEGCYWVAMFEGARVLRLSPAGEVLRELRLPVQCPTMPAFGGADLRTLYITTSRENRPAAELAAQPWAGCVLQVRVDVPGLPANLYLG